jgi:hypothetical protein
MQALGDGPARREGLMLGWFRALMPKQERFFEHFVEHAQLTLAAAEALKALVGGTGDPLNPVMIGEIYTVRRPMPVLLSIVLVCIVSSACRAAETENVVNPPPTAMQWADLGKLPDSRPGASLFWANPTATGFVVSIQTAGRRRCG